MGGLVYKYPIHFFYPPSREGVITGPNFPTNRAVIKDDTRLVNISPLLPPSLSCINSRNLTHLCKGVYVRSTFYTKSQKSQPSIGALKNVSTCPCLRHAPPFIEGCGPAVSRFHHAHSPEPPTPVMYVLDTKQRFATATTRTG